MPKADEPSRNEPGSPLPEPDDRRVDLTPFEFLPVRLRGADQRPTQSSSDDRSDDGGS
jgi:hypothetical protein